MDGFNRVCFRGTIIDDFSFLFWTNGLTENQELNGKYFQGKRGTPLLIKRFGGTHPNSG